ncbi:MAG: SoxR reducing system RseC family protein [Gammaproteobacteria bacterium]|jgi:sigma-E factor negative regulatory protein RseC
MILERGVVRERQGDYAWLECDSQAGCARCAEGRGCGGGLFSRLLGDRLRRMRVLNTLDAGVGEYVIVGLEESAVVTGSLVAYGLPLVGLLVGAIGADALLAGSNDLAELVGGAAGFGLAWLGGRRLAGSLALAARFQPVMLRADDGRACLRESAAG